MVERYTSEEAWKEAQALSAMAEGRANREGRDTTSQDFQGISEIFDRSRQEDPATTDRIISENAEKYEMFKSLGPERETLLRIVMNEYQESFQDRVQTAQKVFIKQSKELKWDAQVRADEGANMTMELTKALIQEVKQDSRIIKAFARDEQVLDTFLQWEAKQLRQWLEQFTSERL